MSFCINDIQSPLPKPSIPQFLHHDLRDDSGGAHSTLCLFGAPALPDPFVYSFISHDTPKGVRVNETTIFARQLFSQFE